MLLTVSTIVPAIIVNICCIVTDMFANVVEYDVVISFSHIMYTHICILYIYIYTIVSIDIYTVGIPT